MSTRLKTDWPLFTATMLILAFGLVMVYSASSVVAEVMQGKQNWTYAARQLGFAVIGLMMMFGMKRLDYTRLQHPLWIWLPFSVVGVLLVAVIWADPNAHRWFRFAGVQFQPSELAKPAIILFLAWFVSRRENKVIDRYTLAPAALVVGGLTTLIAWGDLGTAAIVLVPAAVVFFVAGIERKYFYMTLVLGLCLTLFFLWQKPYRLFRIMAFCGITEQTIHETPALKWIEPHLAASKAARDADHQPRQARIASGSGGITGVGLGRSYQKLGFLPEAHTDFIYAVIAEETGLVGAIALLAGYLVVFWRGFRLYWTAHDAFGRYLALGCVSLIVAQALFNMSMVISILPTKGIPLPLVSYGGSALVCTMITFGLMMSVSERAAD
ncbi:MAG TPA: putative peptidoglycan glycosyltransferase FtsW [Bryobacteraceae bacterium]|nr:putative peptidoglycan glycosyltransferase FtsW [Bryobacteraceae bacterium]